MKTILITGVTRGLGLALAKVAMAAGHRVVGCGRGAEGIMDLRFSHGAPHRFDVVDVALAAKVDVWAESVLATHGAPDILVNNAALITPEAPLWKVEGEAFSKLIDVNVKGVANVVRAFVPAMMEAGRGVVVNLSSGWGRGVSPGFAPYCASKWAVEGMTKALAEELPEPLSAVPMSPGIIDTEMLRTCGEEFAKTRPGPEAWAEVALPFILSLGRAQNGESCSVPEPMGGG